MKAIFIGSANSSHILLNEIISQGAVEICGVVTKTKSTINADFIDLSPIAKKISCELFLFEGKEKNNLDQWVKKLNPDIIFCFGWSHLLTSTTLTIPRLGCIGYHPTALPFNRGRHPIIWTLVLGLNETASTFFMMEPDADTGDIVSQKKLPVYDSDTSTTLYDRLLLEAKSQIRDICQQLSQNRLNRIPQNMTQSNSWRKRSEMDGKIDWRMSTKAICNLVRALAPPYPGATALYQDETIKILKAEAYDRDAPFNVEPGKILKSDKSFFIVKTYDGAVKINEFLSTKIPQAGEYL